MKIALDLKALSLNNCYSGVRYKTPEKKRYDRALQILLPKTPVVGPYYRVSLRFFLKRCWGGDLDNLCKGVLDNLVTRGVISEDRRVVEILLQKFPAKRDRIEIDVESVSEYRSEAFTEDDE